MVDEPETGRLEPYGKRLSSPGCYRATLDAIYASGKSYYLVADGPVAYKGYAVLCRGMVDRNHLSIPHSDTKSTFAIRLPTVNAWR